MTTTETATQQATCPTWCIYPGKCGREHMGKEWGTVDNRRTSPCCRRPEGSQPRHSGRQGSVRRGGRPAARRRAVRPWHDRDWQVDLTLKEARLLLDGLRAAIAEAESV